MINQIRADFYRQRHSRGLLVLAGLTILLAAVACSAEAVGGIMVNTSSTQLNTLTAGSWTVYDGLRAATMSGSVLSYLFIGIFTIVIGYEFSQATYKNTLLTGISRLGFVLAKYVTLLIDLFIGLVLFYGTTFLTGVLAGRKLGTSGGQLLSFTVPTLLATMFFISVIYSLAVVLLLWLQSPVISVVFIALWPLLLATLTVVTQWHWLRYLDFLSMAAGIAFQSVSLTETWRVLMVSGLMLVGSILLATVAIRQREL